MCVVAWCAHTHKSTQTTADGSNYDARTKRPDDERTPPILLSSHEGSNSEGYQDGTLCERMNPRMPTMMSFLGTGSIVPTRSRSYSAILVETDGEMLLFDCGPCTVLRLIRLGRGLSRMKRVFLTHFHIDHTADLVVLLKSRVFHKNADRSMLRVYGPQGLLRFKSDLFSGVEAWRYLSSDLHALDSVEWKETSEGIVERSSGWVVSCAPVTHSGGVAYRLDTKDGSFAYSGDTAPDQRLVKLAKGVEVLVHECSFPDRQALAGLHTTATEVGFLADAIGCRSLILTHLYPECEGREQDMIDQISRVFNGEVFLAYDFFQLELKRNVTGT